MNIQLFITYDSIIALTQTITAAFITWYILSTALHKFLPELAQGQSVKLWLFIAIYGEPKNFDMD